MCAAETALGSSEPVSYDPAGGLTPFGMPAEDAQSPDGPGAGCPVAVRSLPRQRVLWARDGVLTLRRRSS